jgi:Flp pilus assembly protein TadG
MNVFSQKRNKFGYRAQAMVEFAIALPVLLALLVGIMEVGRMILTYTLVNNASRDAVRYASAYGKGDDGLNKYNNCAGIIAIARKSAFIVTLSSVSISYKDKNGNTPASPGNVCNATSGEDTDITVDSNWTVTVTVQASYKPVVKLIPIGQKNFTATSTRTILGIFDLPNP